MDPHQVDENYVRSHQAELHRVNQCARCKPRMQTVFDGLLWGEIDIRRIATRSLVVLIVLLVVLVLPYVILV